MLMYTEIVTCVPILGTEEIFLLVCVDLDKMPLLCKPKKLYMCSPVGSSINSAITYCTPRSSSEQHVGDIIDINKEKKRSMH